MVPGHHFLSTLVFLLQTLCGGSFSKPPKCYRSYLLLLPLTCLLIFVAGQGLIPYGPDQA